MKTFKSDRCGIEITIHISSGANDISVQIRPLRDWNFIFTLLWYRLVFRSNQTVAGLKYTYHPNLMRSNQSSNQTVAGLKSDSALKSTSIGFPVQIRPLRDWNDTITYCETHKRWTFKSDRCGIEIIEKAGISGQYGLFKSDRCGIEMLDDLRKHIPIKRGSNQTVAGLKWSDPLSTLERFSCSNQTVAGLKSFISLSVTWSIIGSNQTVAGLKCVLCWLYNSM